MKACVNVLAPLSLHYFPLRRYVLFSSMPYADPNVLKFVQTWTAVLSQQQMDDSLMLLTVNYMSGNDHESV